MCVHVYVCVHLCIRFCMFAVCVSAYICMHACVCTSLHYYVHIFCFHVYRNVKGFLTVYLYFNAILYSQCNAIF